MVVLHFAHTKYAQSTVALMLGFRRATNEMFSIVLYGALSFPMYSGGKPSKFSKAEPQVLTAAMQSGSAPLCGAKAKVPSRTKASAIFTTGVCP